MTTRTGCRVVVSSYETYIYNPCPEEVSPIQIARCVASLALAACIVASVLTAQQLPVGPIAPDCNRSCLEGLINQYLEALVAHDPKRLPLSADVKYTEQEQIMAVGDGFWKSVTGRGNYNHYFADPVAGQAGWMGTMREKGGLLLMTVRLRVQLGRITEIETSYFRAGGGGSMRSAALCGRTACSIWMWNRFPNQAEYRRGCRHEQFRGRLSSIHVTEAFRIENNMIRRVEMIGTGVPYHFNSTWGSGLSGK